MTSTSPPGPPRRAYTATEKARRSDMAHGSMVEVSQRAPSEPRPSRDQRHAELVAAAKRCFSSKGYHATTVDDITRAAGVAKGTFYLYFDEKREIYYEVIRSFMQLIKDIGASITATSADPRDLFARAEQAARELIAV